MRNAKQGNDLNYTQLKNALIDYHMFYNWVIVLQGWENITQNLEKENFFCLFSWLLFCTEGLRKVNQNSLQVYSYVSKNNKINLYINKISMIK